MVICLERVADLHMAQLMLLLLIVSCFSKIGFTFLVPAQPGSLGKRADKWVYACVCVFLSIYIVQVLCICGSLCHSGHFCSPSYAVGVYSTIAISVFAINALTLLVEHREEHPVCKN